MPRDKDRPASDLEATRDARLATERLVTQQEYHFLIRRARDLHARVGIDTGELDALLAKSGHALNRLKDAARGKVYGRKRPQGTNKDEILVFLDECGDWNLSDTADFDVFALAAVLVPAATYERTLDPMWKGWKATNLGSAAELVHEPDIRYRRYGFKNATPELLASLDQVLAELPFHAVVCVIRRSAYQSQFGTEAMDESLPNIGYLMALDFVLERVVMAMDRLWGGGVGTIIAEARGPYEDALIQFEAARLHLAGTSYISSSWFRQQLKPGIEFLTKRDNSTGLQIADLVVRPCADRIIDPASTPTRWDAVRGHLCDGIETKHSIIGLKVLPWDDQFADIWKSERGPEAPDADQVKT